MISTNVMLLFDLDGTLWDSGKEVAISWNEVLQKELPQMKPLDADYVHSVMGMTMREIADHTIIGTDEENKRRIFKECEVNEVEYLRKSGGVLFPNVKSTLETLQNQGYTMTVVSNCQKGYIDAFMTSMDTKKYFVDFEEWGNTLRSKAENIRLVMKRNGFEKAIYIGDTQKDMNAATDAHVPFVHVTYGFGKVVEPFASIDDFSGLLEVIQNYNLD